MNGVLPYNRMSGPAFNPAPIYPRAYAPTNPAPMPSWPPVNQIIHCLVEFKRGRTVQYESPAYVAPGAPAPVARTTSALFCTFCFRYLLDCIQYKFGEWKSNWTPPLERVS